MYPLQQRKKKTYLKSIFSGRRPDSSADKEVQRIREMLRFLGIEDDLKKLVNKDEMSTFLEDYQKCNPQKKGKKREFNYALLYLLPHQFAEVYKRGKNERQM